MEGKVHVTQRAFRSRPQSDNYYQKQAAKTFVEHDDDQNCTYAKMYHFTLLYSTVIIQSGLEARGDITKS
jgi:hypothetical protein